MIFNILIVILKLIIGSRDFEKKYIIFYDANEIHRIKNLHHKNGTMEMKEKNRAY